MEQVEMNNMFINIDVNKGSEKCTEKTLRLVCNHRYTACNAQAPYIYL
jgi:hypothetical protein